jgi:hypothetical protein
MNRAAVVAVGLILGTTALAQTPVYRDHQEAVLAPPPTQAPRPAPDVVKPFESAYEAAGAPRIMLFWNVAFDDQTQTQHEKRELTTKAGTQSSTGLDKQTQGPAGEATLKESDVKNQETIETVTRERIVDSAKQAERLSARNSVELEVAFQAALEEAGVHLLSRSSGIRLTQAERDRSGVDPKLIEADAVRDHADLLLEIVMVQDADAALNAGFKVTLTDVRSATEVLTRYTQAHVHRSTQPVRTVVTDTGFERRASPTPPVTVSDVGVELAHEVMGWLAPTLVAAAARPAPKK